MASSQRSTRLFALQRSSTVCSFCRPPPARRSYATLTPSTTNNVDGISSSLVRDAFQIRAGVVVSRPPQITRDLSPFEEAFYLYQRRLNERTALPFTRYFHFKKNTPPDIEWKRKVKDRVTAARDIGIYNAYGTEGWNDELLVGAPESKVSHQVEALLKDAEPPAIDEADPSASGQVQQEPVEPPMPRLTEADAKNDVKSLNRLLQKTLYLIIKQPNGQWEFPNGLLVGKENLHRAAERILVQSAGLNMNTWLVGNVPIGYQTVKFSEPVVNTAQGTEEIGHKTFYIKARIMAGQANLKENPFGLTDFQWLSKDELSKLVSADYWKAVRNMLANR